MKHTVRKHHKQAHGKRNKAHHGKGREHARNGREYQKRRHDAHQVKTGTSFAFQALGLNMGAADQVATRGTVSAGMTHAANADLVAIMRAGGKLNRLLGGYASTTAAAAIGTRVRHDLTGTAALGADRLERARAKQEGQVDVDVAATAAARTGMCMLG